MSLALFKDICTKMDKGIPKDEIMKFLNDGKSEDNSESVTKQGNGDTFKCPVIELNRTTFTCLNTNHSCKESPKLFSLLTEMSSENPNNLSNVRNIVNSSNQTKSSISDLVSQKLPKLFSLLTKSTNEKCSKSEKASKNEISEEDWNISSTTGLPTNEISNKLTNEENVTLNKCLKETTLFDFQQQSSKLCESNKTLFQKQTDINFLPNMEYENVQNEQNHSCFSNYFQTNHRHFAQIGNAETWSDKTDIYNGDSFLNSNPFSVVNNTKMSCVQTFNGNHQRFEFQTNQCNQSPVTSHSSITVSRSSSRNSSSLHLYSNSEDNIFGCLNKEMFSNNMNNRSYLQEKDIEIVDWILQHDDQSSMDTSDLEFSESNGLSENNSRSSAEKNIEDYVNYLMDFSTVNFPTNINTSESEQNIKDGNICSAQSNNSTISYDSSKGFSSINNFNQTFNKFPLMSVLLTTEDE